TERTDVGGTGLCQTTDGAPLRGRGAGLLHCRFDFDIGFDFNVIRTGTAADAVTIEVDGGGAPATTDLTHVADDWGANTCVAGDVHFGTPSTSRGVLSLGAYNGIATCGAAISQPDQYTFTWE